MEYEIIIQIIIIILCILKDDEDENEKKKIPDSKVNENKVKPPYSYVAMIGRTQSNFSIYIYIYIYTCSSILCIIMFPYRQSVRFVLLILSFILEFFFSNQKLRVFDLACPSWVPK